MSDDRTCSRCECLYLTPDDQEPLEVCNECAAAELATLRAERDALAARAAYWEGKFELIVKLNDRKHAALTKAREALGGLVSGLTAHIEWQDRPDDGPAILRADCWDCADKWKVARNALRAIDTALGEP